MTDKDKMLSLEATTAIIGGYLGFSMFFGPWVMRDRKPFSFRTTIVIYNVVKILMNVHLFYVSYVLLGGEVFSFWSNVCDPVSAANNYGNVKDKLYEAAGYYLITKLIDLPETVFFILRKKTEQATTAHIFHHATMVVNIVLMDHLNTIEEVLAKMLGVNSALHISLHSYYLLTNINQKFLYLKKYMSLLTLIEVTIVMTMLLRNFLTCNSPFSFLAFWSVEMVLLLCLFLLYFRTTYMMKNKNE